MHCHTLRFGNSFNKLSGSVVDPIRKTIHYFAKTMYRRLTVIPETDPAFPTLEIPTTMAAADENHNQQVGHWNSVCGDPECLHLIYSNTSMNKTQNRDCFVTVERYFRISFNRHLKSSRLHNTIDAIVSAPPKTNWSFLLSTDHFNKCSPILCLAFSGAESCFPRWTA